MRINLLFVCSSAVDRSPTAAGLFVHSKKYIATAAGTYADAKQRVSQKLLDWADFIFVMSEGTNGHTTYLKRNFNLKGKRVHDLHIRDMYFKNDPRLIRRLKTRISKIIDF